MTARIFLFTLTLACAMPLAVFAGGGHDTTAEEAGGHDHAPEAVAITLWGSAYELFMQYPPAVAGTAGTFVVHLTVLDGFQPVRAGELELHFVSATGEEVSAVTSELLRVGIFAPTATLPRAGTWDCEVRYRGPNGTETFRVGSIDVAEPGHVPHIHAAADEGAIPFLKEQQWKVPFATEQARMGEVRTGAWAVARVLPAPAASAEITAPVAGVLHVADPADLALPGAQVAKGDIVARIAPPLAGGGWTESRLALAQAERDLARAERLHDLDAVSDRDLEKARNTYLALKAGHDGLAGGGDEVLDLTAPIAGRVVGWQARPGRRLEAGDPLLTIIDPTVVWVRVELYERDFRRLGTPAGLLVRGADSDWHVPSADLRLLTAGGTIDPATRTVPVLLEVDNSAGRLTVDEVTPVEIYGTDGSYAITVPVGAVYEDEGVDVVFVQAGGESFVKRIVRLGPRYGGRVAVLEGVWAAERVVSRGGYHIKLASTTAEIGHGHAH